MQTDRDADRQRQTAERMDRQRDNNPGNREALIKPHFKHVHVHKVHIKAALKIVATSLEARDAFKVIVCFLQHGYSKACIQVHFCFI